MTNIKPFVIAFSGRIKSGKSLLSAEIANSLGWKRVSFGDQARKIAEMQGHDPHDRAILQEIGEEQVNKNRRGFCQDVIAQAVGWTRNDGLVIDGLRHLEIAKELSQLVTPLRLRIVYINADDKTIESRVGPTANTSLLRQWESHSTEAQVPQKLPDVADLIVPGSIEIERAKSLILSAIDSWL